MSFSLYIAYIHASKAWMIAHSSQAGMSCASIIDSEEGACIYIGYRGGALAPRRIGKFKVRLRVRSIAVRYIANLSYKL